MKYFLGMALALLIGIVTFGEAKADGCPPNVPTVESVLIQVRADKTMKSVTVTGQELDVLKSVILKIEPGRLNEFDKNVFILKEGAETILVMLSKNECVLSIGQIKKETYDKVVKMMNESI